MPRRGSYGYYGDYDYAYGYYYPPSQPREVKGGIKAQSQRGDFGSSWWAKRWIAVLEGFDIGTRLSRGRSYARKGQVLDIQIEPGTVTAKVQGSAPRPYNVRIQVKPLASAEWEAVARVIASQAIFAAKLLNGEMPQDIESAFAEAGTSLFPQKLSDLKTSCSCPDWSNPCKHIAAVYYLIGEEFDRDPFLLFKLRGLDREQLLTLLGPQVADSSASAGGEADVDAPEPLPSDPAAFWEGASLDDGALGQVRTPPVSAALLRRLGKFPFWRGEQPLLEALEPVYTAASRRAAALYEGELP
jgi:uncharacterized Zn finger protein